MFRKDVDKLVDEFGSLPRIEKDGCIEVVLTHEAYVAIQKQIEEVHRKFTVPEKNLETGLMGQAADAYELKHNWKEGVDQMTTEPDRYDILYRGFATDAKTFDARPFLHDEVSSGVRPFNIHSSFTRKPNSLMAVNQLKFYKPERYYPFYIGNLRLTDDKILIMGFMTRLTLEELERKSELEIYDRSVDSVDAAEKAKNIVVREFDQFTPIQQLGPTIDHMLTSADKFVSSLKHKRTHP